MNNRFRQRCKGNSMGKEYIILINSAGKNGYS